MTEKNNKLQEIDKKEILDFVGNGYDYVQCHRLFSNRFRIDCYEYHNIGIMKSRKIVKSYFVHYKNGIIDKTIHENKSKKPLWS